MKIKVPKTINDLRIRHIDILNDEKYRAEDLDLDTIVNFVAGITGEPLDKLYQVDFKDLTNIFYYCIDLFDGFKITDPKKIITIEGLDYKLVDPMKVGIGWHIDISKSDFEKNPALLAASCYLPVQCKHYGETDEYSNIKYPRFERAEIFNTHMDLPTYLNVLTFFFLESMKQMKRHTALQKREVRKIQTFGFGSN